MDRAVNHDGVVVRCLSAQLWFRWRRHSGLSVTSGTTAIGDRHVKSSVRSENQILHVIADLTLTNSKN